MMNLAVMRQLVAEAETGDKSMPTAHQALAHWDYDPGSMQHLRYSANATYTFKQNGVTRLLRLSHSSDRTPSLIQAELDFITHLRLHGLSAMPPLPSQSGAYLASVHCPYADFHASVFEFAPGDPYLERDDLTSAQLEAWGRLMAELHQASHVYIHPGPSRPSWQEIIRTVASWLPPEETLALNYLEQARSWLSILPAGSADYGLIHWDLCIDNLSWDNGRYHIFDFDDAAYFWYAADLAFALEEVLEMPESSRARILKPFLAGYSLVRPSIQPWLESLPRFLKFMHVFKYARVLNALASADPSLDPPWLAGLRTKLTRLQDTWREQFADLF